MGRFGCFLALLTLVVSPALPAAPPPKAGSTQVLEQRIAGLTARLSTAAGIGRKAFPERESAAGVVALAADRAAAMAELIERNPARALRIGLSTPDREQLLRAFPQIGRNLELRGHWGGTVTRAIEDRFRARQSTERYWLRSAQETLHLYFPETPHCVKAGGLADVRGLRLGARVAVAGLTRLAAAQQPGCDTKGDQKVIAILVTFPNVAAPQLTPEDVRQVLFASDRSLDSYWKEASYGVASASGDVIGWLELDRSYRCDEEMELAVAAAKKAGEQVDLTKYSRIFVYFPEPEGGCDYGGEGTVGCLSTGLAGVPASVTWLPVSSAWTTDYHLFVAAHEGGHNLGAMHAASRTYDSEPLGAPELEGARDSYGDPFSPMGDFSSSLGHYNIQEKLAIGWLADKDVTTVEHEATVRLSPITATPAEGQTKAAKVRRIQGVEDWLWLEYRQPTGAYEPSLPSAAFGGATVHYTDASNGAGGYAEGETDLLDLTSPFGTFEDAPLAAGLTWADRWSPRTMQVQDAGPDGLSVSLREEACATLSASVKAHGAGTESGTIAVTAPPACQWGVLSSTSWVVPNSPAPGTTITGNGTVSYTVRANPKLEARTATLAIGRRPVEIQQAAFNLPPDVTGVYPTSGSGPSGSFDMYFDDANGIDDIAIVRMNFNDKPDLAGGCAVEYDTTAQTVRLSDGASGWLGPVDVYSVSDLRSSQCRLALVDYLGGDLWVVVALLQPGDLNIYGSAQDQSGADTGWVQLGAWTVTPDAPPVTIGVSPGSGRGRQQTFTFRFSDPNGAQDIETAGVRLYDSNGACQFYAFPLLGEFMMGDQYGLSGDTETLTSDGCLIDLRSSQTLQEGNELRVVANITFKDSFASTVSARMDVWDYAGASMGRSQIFSWEVAPAPGATPAITIEGVVNAASFARGPVAPGEIVTIFGSDLGPDCGAGRPECSPDGVAHAFYDEAGYLSNLAGSTKVFFDGIQAPMIYSSKYQVSAVVPYYVWFQDTTTLRVEHEGRASNDLQIPVAESAPGIFKAPFTFGERGRGIIVNAGDGSMNSAAAPAARGSIVTFFATGEGQTWPFGIDGRLPRTGEWPEPFNDVGVTFGGIAGKVLFSGLTYAGVLQLNVQVPESAPAGEVPLILQIGKITSPDDTVITLK